MKRGKLYAIGLLALSFALMAGLVFWNYSQARTSAWRNQQRWVQKISDRMSGELMSSYSWLRDYRGHSRATLRNELYAHPRFAGILKSHSVQKAVAHCFTGEKEELHAYLDLGLYIGITGWICDERRGQHLLALVRDIPRDKLLLETDSPYLTPRDLKPQPKARRNEPAFLPHIARAVAKALGRPVEEIAAETTRNARTLFGLK